MKTFVFDIDGTICTNTYGKYESAKPYYARINHINKLYDEGNYIKYFTARGSTTGINWHKLTQNQLSEWNAKYNELILGKPEGDFFIDDKGYNSEKWNWENSLSNHDLKLTQEYLRSNITETTNALNFLLNDIQTISKISNLSISIKKSLKRGGKIIFAGNGGSFADAQHLSAEFISKLSDDRSPLASIALGTNSSAITAISNDYGYQNVFARELEALGQKNDFLIAISTSGNSKNIIELIEKSKLMCIDFSIFTGSSGGACSKYKDKLIKVSSNKTTIIQQVHILLGHIICQISEEPFLVKSSE